MKLVNITAKVPTDWEEQLKTLAHETGKSPSELIRVFVRAGLDHNPVDELAIARAKANAAKAPPAARSSKVDPATGKIVSVALDPPAQEKGCGDAGRRSRAASDLAHHKRAA